MKPDSIYSKEWCDLVFEHRNKAYGAYELRAQTGKRYKRVFGFLLGVFASLIVLVGGFSLYVHFVVEKEMKEAADAFAHKPSDLKEGYEVKFVATARQAPSVRMKPGAKSAMPKIVDGLPPINETIGLDGPIDYDPKDQVITTPIVDTTGIHDETLPVAKQKIVPTEQVSQLPDFPGGLRAFMRWLNEHIVYPNDCINRQRQGSITVTFIVGTDGYATDLEVKNAFDSQIYRSAMNALKAMPKWKPGTDEEGKPTPVRITIPVEFKLG